MFLLIFVDYDSLPVLRESDLERMGLTIGPMRKLMAAIAELPTQSRGTCVAIRCTYILVHRQH